MPEIGIGAIGIVLPEQRSDTAGLAERLGISQERLASRIGFRALARMADGHDTSDLALAAVQALLAQGVRLADVQCLCVVTQNPDGGGIPSVSSILHGRLDLPYHVATFDIAHGCSGFVYGLGIAKAFMEAHGFEHGILVTADPYSKIVDTDDLHTALIFGDAAAATLLTTDYTWHIGKVRYGTAGAQAAALRIQDDGLLYMNGKAVAKFCAKVVPEAIMETLDYNQLGLDDIDEVLLHQGSRYIVETIGQALGVPDKTPFLAEEYGNAVSSSLPLALALHVEAATRRVVISGFGVGLSWATTVLTRMDPVRR